MENAFITMLVQIFGELILAVIGIAAAWVLSKIAKSAELSNIHRAMQEVVAASEETVLELQQTVVEGWKAGHADGKLTKEEIDSLNCQLVSKTLNKLSAPATQVLHAAGVDLSGIIRSSAEALIARMKAK